MQADDVSVVKPFVTLLSLDVGHWGVFVNVAIFIATAIYVWITYKLWRSALSNQKEIIENKSKIAKIDQYFTLRRIWRSIDYISSRNKAYRAWKDLPNNFTGDISLFTVILMSREAWEDFSLIAHFMVDVFIEHQRGNITAGEMREGFAEFRWWAPRLRRLFEAIEGEERMAETLLEIEKITPPTDTDRKKIHQQFGGQLD